MRKTRNSGPLVGEAPATPQAPPALRPERYETYAGGSPEAERVIFEKLARDLMFVQLKVRRRSDAGVIKRAFHAKAILGVENARLRFRPDLPEDLRVGFAQPDAEYPVTVRLSNASGRRQPDFAPDLRGAALRVRVGPDETHDLLMTNYPVSHARNAAEFVAFAKVMAGADTTPRKAFALYVKLPLAVGWTTAVRMRRNVRAGTERPVRSLALETYWSRAAILWGGAGPVRYRLRPAAGEPSAPPPSRGDPDYLWHEISARLARSDVVFELCVQRYVDGYRTPIENADAWRDDEAPVIPVATLTIPRQDLDTADARAVAIRVDELSFDPWNTTDEFRPLGNLNRARKAAYEASSAHRHGYRFVTPTPKRNVVAGRLLRRGFRVVNRFVPWHRLPTRLGVLNLTVIREVLRRANLIDTEIRQAPPRPHPVPPPIDEQLLVRRSYDGSYNDLSAPLMGAVGATFGRNMPPVYEPDRFNVPNPVTVSRELLHRDTFIPARSLNLIAAAWIQFQVHDWVQHKRHPVGTQSVEVPLPPGMTWTNTPGGTPENVMRFADDQAKYPGAGGPPTLYGNVASHWWDGSEVYGGDETVAKFLREPDGGAKLRLENGHLPSGPEGIPLAGFRENWWLGLSLMHTLFAREHNVLCDALRSEYPRMDEERIYHTARLIVSALLAKIHTVEWTPAILATEMIDITLNANWSGPRGWLTRLGAWLVEEHALTGITETLPEHHTAPYSLTEDFVTVYRMHPLIPDDYEFADHRSGQILDTLGLKGLLGAAAEPLFRKVGLADVLYSFGIAHPGAITLHNYPRTLQALERDGEIIDLSVVDIVRTRRRGVPRYNDFLAGVHKPRLRRFEDLTSDPRTLARLKDVYRTVDDVDTMIGLYAENPPEGFGFSDTAFRIFILMASRRLQSDRFLTVDFRPEVYTPLGMDWLARNGMKDVILRHCPELAGLMPRTASAFAPWRLATPDGTAPRKQTAGERTAGEQATGERTAGKQTAGTGRNRRRG